MILNFGALALGSIFTAKGVASDWYVNANQAPWTPPGIVFGIAWSAIMFCFSFYMTRIIDGVGSIKPKTIYIVFAIQLLLNVLWNPAFFYFHKASLALVLIISLLVTVTWFLVIGKKHSVVSMLLVLPYFLWLLIAISLNAYIVMANNS
ncbi:MAG: TspO/MBR family protein [Bacteroidia bacterium]